MLRELRAAFRITRVGLHLCWGAATVAVAYPWLDERWRRALKRRWSRQLLEILGVKLGAGDTVPPPGLIVCNHISWLDIFVINALTPAAFVAKAEVKDWPLIGWLCARTETLFLERGSRTSARRTIEAMVESLKRGIHVAVFPEGTTTAGDCVLPFRAALFQAAIEAETPVIPLALGYADHRGKPSRAPAYDGEITFWQCLRAIAAERRLVAELRVLGALESRQSARGELARRSRENIILQLGNRHFAPAGKIATDGDLLELGIQPAQ
ncbi:lysophospholipid acyltransferase family protein [Sulfuricystis multivorans]|uniref:lysophospholipid acyltransferase family protein n=1 Tax=Sulfuricystis multivorans TaxID=2211108 RepID=UPI000F829BC5|nr:lysophospholipid acyltransferase family protein [Sulfuricystis multivorans]